MATPKYRAPETRPVRAAAYIVVASYVVIAMAHLYTLEGFTNPFYKNCFWYLIAMGVTYLLGAMFYVSRIPERFWPGAFDYVVGPRRCALFLVRFSSALPRVHRACCAIPFHRLL